jgi:hypothetical protein
MPVLDLPTTGWRRDYTREVECLRRGHRLTAYVVEQHGAKLRVWRDRCGVVATWETDAERPIPEELAERAWAIAEASSLKRVMRRRPRALAGAAALM